MTIITDAQAQKFYKALVPDPIRGAYLLSADAGRKYYDRLVAAGFKIEFPADRYYVKPWGVATWRVYDRTKTYSKSCVATFYGEHLGKDVAERKANELCDELNSR